MSNRRPKAPAGRAPVSLLVLASVGLLFVALPVLALVLRTPWSRVTDSLADPVVLDALRLSMISAFGAALVAAVVGIPIAWVLARTDFAGRSVLRALVLVPLVLPPVVGGVALLLAFGPRGILGPALEQLGIVLPFTTAATVVAAAFVALPFLVLSVEGALTGADGRYEDVAATLGAGRLRTFVSVTLPMVAPSIAAGLVLAWARALGEFGATITFAGNLPGVTQTMPLAVYQMLPVDPDGSLTLSMLLLAISVGVVIGMRNRWLPGLRRELPS
ncbi:MAG: ABC transporter permease [Actinomycetes bacterium]